MTWSWVSVPSPQISLYNNKKKQTKENDSVAAKTIEVYWEYKLFSECR